MEDISINKSNAERSICWHGKSRDFPGGSVVKTSPSNRGGASSLPGGGARIPYVSWPKKRNTEQKQPCNEFSKDFKIGPHQIIFKKKKKARVDKLNDINTHSTLSTDAGNYFNNYVIKKSMSECPDAPYNCNQVSLPCYCSEGWIAIQSKRTNRREPQRLGFSDSRQGYSIHYSYLGDICQSARPREIWILVMI